MATVRDPGDDIARVAYEKAVAAIAATSHEAAQAAAFKAVMDAIAAGNLPQTQINQRYAHDKATKADQTVTSSGKALVEKLARGQLGLPDIYDAIVPTGDGLTVKRLGAFRFADIMSYDLERYKNVHEVQESYHLHHTMMVGRWGSVLVQQPDLTIKEAGEQGLIS